MPINTALFSNVPQARVDPAAFDTSNALNRAVQMSQFVNQNELARRKQAEADMLKNALANVDLSSPESMENLLRIPGGAQIATQLQQYQTGRQTADKQLVAERIKQYDTRLARIQTPGEAQEWVRDIANDPLLKSHMVATGFDPIRELGEIPQDPAAIAKWRLDMMATPESVRTEAKPMQVSAGASLMTPTGEVIGTAPATPARPTLSETERISQQLQDPALPPDQRKILEDRLTILTTRAPTQPPTPPAPTVTEIQDPTNPNQMLRIDARTYQGGGVGAPGVIGTSGKAPSIATAEQKRTEGAAQAKDILDALRASYDELDRLRAIPSEQRNVLSNTLSYIASTGVGQVAGRLGGTREQTQRDIIGSARNQLLNAVKNATGMTAQQLNSNVEFRSWLEALTDTTRSIEANRSILDNLERFIASGGKYSTKKNEVSGKVTSTVDALLDKYK